MGSDKVDAPLAASNPTVSVIVPTKNAGRTIKACLLSLRAQSYPCRVIVVDNASTDFTPALAKEGADIFLEAGPERSAQRNHGARACPADIVGFIDADMVLGPTVVEEAVAAIGGGSGSVIVPERTTGSGFWVQVRAFERSFYQGSDSLEAARFFRWDVFERAGGFDEELTGAEDWDLTESTRVLAPVTRTDAVIDHDEGSIGYIEACRKKAHYAEGLRRYVAKRGFAALRQVSHRPWLRQPGKLVCLKGAGLVALKAGEATAMAAVIARGWLRVPCAARQRHGSMAAPGTSGLSNNNSLQLNVVLVTWGPVMAPQAGWAVRARGVIDDLTRSCPGVAITVLSAGERAGNRAGRAKEGTVVVDLPNGFHGWSVQLVKRCMSLADWADVMIVESAWFLPVVLTARAIAGGRRLKVVWDTNDCETYHYSQLPPTAKNRALAMVWRALESLGAARSDYVVALSATHAELWRRYFPRCGGRVGVVDFHPLTCVLEQDDTPVQTIDVADDAPSNGYPELAFVGTLVAKHNAAAVQWLIEELAPKLKTPARLRLIGPGTDTIKLPERRGLVIVEALGAVPDLAPVLRRARLCLAPLLSSAGPKTKVLDYVAAGSLVVGTPVAYEGLEGCPGFTVATLDEFARAVEDVLANSETAAEVTERRAAQIRWLMEQHGPDKTARQWREVFIKLGLVSA